LIRLSTRKLILLNNILVVTLPSDWTRRFKLIKGDSVDMLITENALVLFDGRQDFEVKELQQEIDEALYEWEKEKEETELEWMRLTPEEKAEVLRLRAELEKADEELDEGTVPSIDDSPDTSETVKKIRAAKARQQKKVNDDDKKTSGNETKR
jgi:hypothetical protein